MVSLGLKKKPKKAKIYEQNQSLISYDLGKDKDCIE